MTSSSTKRSTFKSSVAEDGSFRSGTLPDCCAAMASFTACDTAAAMVFVRARTFSRSVPASSGGSVTALGPVLGPASCMSEAEVGARTRLARLEVVVPAVRFLGGMTQGEEISYIIIDVRRQRKPHTIKHTISENT